MGQREYVIEYHGKSLLHDFSNMEFPIRTENVVAALTDANTIKGLVIFLKTEDEEMEVFTVATATVHIGCKPVAVEEVIAAGKVNENTYHDAEWIFFDMSAPSDPDMTIDIYHDLARNIPWNEDSGTEWKMTYTLKALMGDRSLKHCTVQPLPRGTFYLRDAYRNTGLVPFSVQLSRWRTWRMLGNTDWIKSWMIAGQAENDLFYFDYIDQLGIDKDNILWHRKLGPSTATSPWTALNSKDHEPTLGKHFSLFSYSTKPSYLFLFLIDEGTLYIRWLFPGNSWLSHSWTKLDISYQPMIKLPFGLSKPDPASLPLSVPLGLLSHICATIISYSTVTPMVYVSGADGNFYVSSQWPLDGFGNWRQIETASVFTLFHEVPFQIGGNFLFALDSKRALWRYPITPGEEDRLGDWQQVPLSAFIIQSFTIAAFDDKLQVIALTSEREVWSIQLNPASASTRWQRVGVNIDFRTSPEAQVSCTSAITGRLDLFAPGTDGKLYTTWWTEQSAWENDHNWVAVVGDRQEFKVSDKGDFKAISRVNGQIEIFATDSAQNIWKNWWS